MTQAFSTWLRPVPWRLPGLARPVYRDCGIGAVAFATAAVLPILGVYLVWGWWECPLWLRFGPLVLLAVAECHRSTSPRFAVSLGAVAVLVDMGLGPSVGSLLMWSDVLYAATVYVGPRGALRLLYGNAAFVALTSVGVWIGSRDFRTFVVSVVYVGIIAMTPVLTGFSVREHREKALAERKRAAQTARLAQLDHQAAVTAERARMARELHDVVANHLSAVAVQSTAALSVKSLDEARLRETLEIIRESSVQGLAEMRRMIGLLRSDSPTGQESVSVPRLTETDRLVDQVRKAGLRVDIEVAGEPRELPIPVDLAAYRVVQETLTNALKHAAPQELRMVFAYAEEHVVITGENGIDPGHITRLPGAKAGLIGMSERVSLLGGVFEAGVRDGRWRVRAELPCDDRVVVDEVVPEPRRPQRAGGVAPAPVRPQGGVG